MSGTHSVINRRQLLASGRAAILGLARKLPPVTSVMGITAAPLIGTMTAMAAVLLPPQFFNNKKAIA